jgi:TP901 family phage tail tape measure protein
VVELEGISVKIGIKNEFSSSLPAITSGLNTVQNQFKTAGTSIQKSFGDSITKSFSSLGSSVVKSITSSFSGIGGKITQSLSSARSALTGFSKNVQDSFKGLSSIKPDVQNTFSGIGKSISSSLSGIKGNVSKSFDGIGSGIKTSINKAVSSISFTSLKTSLAGIGSTVSKSFDGIKTKITGAFNGVKDKISSSLSSAKSSILSFADSAKGGFDKVVAAGQTVQDKMGLVGIAITAVFTTKLKDAISSATSIFMGFDDQMRKVQAVTESTGTEFSTLTSEARLMGATTSYTAQDASEAMTYLGQAGFNSTQIVAAMPATLNLARASMTELGTTADIMSNIMNGFQISANDTGRASDVLSKAANATNTDVTGLGTAMKYAAPLAHQMGWSLEETASAAGMLSNAGIKSDMAGTVLRNAITRLIAPTDKTVLLLEKYGITIDMVNPKTHSLAQILDTLTAAGVSSGNMMSIFGMRAGPGMMALVNQGTGALKNMTQTLESSGGYAQKAADEMDAGWGGVVRVMADTVEALQLSFGSAFAAILTPIVSVVSTVGYAISQLPTPIIYVASALAIAGVAAGTLIVAMAALPTVVGIISTGIGLASGAMLTMAAGAYTATGAVGILEGALALATLPLSTIVLAVGGVIGAFALLGVAFYEIEDKTKIFSQAWSDLQDVWTIGTYYIGIAFDNLTESISGAVEIISGYLHDLIDDSVIGDFVDTITDAYDKVTSFFGDAQSSLHDTAESIRKDEDKTAEGAANVQKSIEQANSGIVTSYNTVDKETGESYASMIENADSAADTATSTSGEIISSNSNLVSSNGTVAESTSEIVDGNNNIISSNDNLISSNQAVTDSSPKITYTIDQSDIESITDPTKGTAFVTADSLNKGVELSDGSMLKFNKAGELVIETLDGIQKRLYDIGNTSLETAENKKIWTFTGNYDETSGKYIDNAPKKYISKAEGLAATEELENYQDSPEGHEAEWMKNNPNDSFVHLNAQAGTGGRAPKIADKYSNLQVNDMLVDKNKQDVIETTVIQANPNTGGGSIKKELPTQTGQASIERGQNYKSGILTKGQGKTPIVDQEGYADAQKRQDQQDKKAAFSASLSGGVSGFLGKSTSGTTEYDRVTESLRNANGEIDIFGKAVQWVGGLSVSGVVTSITGVGVASGSATDESNEMGKSIKSHNYISLSGIVNSIKGIGSEETTAGGKAVEHKGKLSSLVSTKFSGLWGQIRGVGTEQTSASGKGTTHKGVLDRLGSTRMGSVIGQITGIGTQQVTASGKGTGHKSILDRINGSKMGSIIGQITGIGTQQDTSSGKGTTHKGILDRINDTRMGSVIGQIFGVGTETDTSKGKAGFLQSALNLVNSVSFSGLLSAIGNVGLALDGLITRAKNMYERVTDYVFGADENSSGGSSNKSAVTTNNKTTNTTNNNVTIKTYASESNITKWVKRSTGN